MNDFNQLNSALLGGVAGGAVKMQKETPVTRLQSALEQLRRAETSVLSAADKLVGPCPNEAGKDACGPTNAGIFGSIEEMADAISGIAAEIIGHISRVERRL